MECWPKKQLNIQNGGVQNAMSCHWEESDFQANDPTLHENIKSEVMKILPAFVTTVVQETQKQSDKTYASL